LKILTFLKQVPDPNSLRFDVGGRLAPNTARVVNEYEQYGLEAALRIKEVRPDGEVELTVASIGPSSAKDAVARGLAMGADTGILVVAGERRIGSLETARALAEIARRGDYDLIWVGQESSDSGTGNVGPQLSALLDIPFVSNVVSFELDDEGRATLTREIEDGHAQVRVSLPLIACALSGLEEPRYPSLRGIMAARRKPVDELALDDLGADASDVRWSDLRAEERSTQGILIETDSESAARQLVALLRERDLI
jgi:electron transfer flavoprotein beta subunit